MLRYNLNHQSLRRLGLKIQSITQTYKRKARLKQEDTLMSTKQWDIEISIIGWSTFIQVCRVQWRMQGATREKDPNQLTRSKDKFWRDSWNFSKFCCICIFPQRAIIPIRDLCMLETNNETTNLKCRNICVHLSHLTRGFRIRRIRDS